MIRTQLYFPQQQHDRLKALALRQRTSISSIVRQLVDEKFDPDIRTSSSTSTKKSSGQWLIDQAKLAENMGFHGPKDLASKVDEYLYG